jgi:hypothetical protein
MMDGTHILMGYATQAYLASVVAERFANELSSKEKIIDAFFIAGRQVERSMNDGEPTEQVAYYISGARNDTIFNVFESTTPTNSTVLKVVNGF